jgi:hypothetical protein
MLISDYIAHYGADSVAATLRTQPAFAVFNLCWHAPADILPACNALGLATVEQAQAYALNLHNAIGNGAQFAALARPTVPLDLDLMAGIRWTDIHAAVRATGLLAPDNDLDINNGDRSYLMPTLAEWEALARAFPGRNRRHTGSGERHDCDDFTKEFLGWLSSLGYGNLSGGRCCLRMFDPVRVLGGHALVLIITADAGIRWLEPQGGIVYPLTRTQLGGFMFATRVQIGELIF